MSDIRWLRGCGVGLARWAGSPRGRWTLDPIARTIAVRMVPISWSHMQCPKTKLKEARKVAKVAVAQQAPAAAAQQQTAAAGKPAGP